MLQTFQPSQPPPSRLSSLLGIKRYGPDGLAALLASWGEPAYRAKQLLQWLYMRSVCDYAEMTDLPAALRLRLATDEPLAAPEVLKRQVSQDGTRKYLLRLADGACVEAVGIPSTATSATATAMTGAAGAAGVAGVTASAPIIAASAPDAKVAAPSEPHPLRLTVCFSTQVGCAMGCAFCATGTAGLTRSLAPGEMVDQLLAVSQDFGARVTNAVAMGEGEPFANYDATMDALRIMNSPRGLGIGARHLTVSTCGLLAPLRRFSLEPEQFTLAISLHSAVQATRDTLMPTLATQPLTALRSALAAYGERTGRRPSLEYTLIADVNDTPAEVAALISFARGMLCHINLIPLNVCQGDVSPNTPRTSHPDALYSAIAHSPTPPARRAEILAQLQEIGIECSLRRSRGADIASACGQLKGSP